MAMKESDKEKVLAALMDSRRKADMAEVSLRLQNQAGEADKIRDASDRLGDEIDTLLAKLMEEWLGGATAAMAEIRESTAGIEKAMAEIKKKMKIAENVVKAVGYLDDAVAIAKKVFAGGI